MDGMGGDDGHLVARARRGDTDAFRAIVEQHGRRLFRLARRITGNDMDAEDVVQETFIKAHRGLVDQAGYDDRATIGAWLHRIASNQALDLLRARRRAIVRTVNDAPGVPGLVETAPSQAPDPERRAIDAEVRRRIGGAMGRLSPKEKAAFVLRHLEGRSIAEIGESLDMSGNATKQSIFRAVRKVREALRKVAPRDAAPRDAASRIPRRS